MAEDLLRGDIFDLSIRVMVLMCNKNTYIGIFHANQDRKVAGDSSIAR